MGAPLVSCLLFTFSLAAARGLEYALKGHELYIRPPDFLPPQKILWRHNGKKVVRVNGIEQHEYDSYKGRIMLNRYSAELWIKDVRFEDGGEYELEVWHKNQEHPIQSYYHFEVIAKVSITSVTCKMDGDLQAKLVCSAECSHPQLLTFEWSFNGNQYPGSNLTIGLNKDDERVFTCRVKDPLSKAEATFAASKCFPEKHQIVILIAVAVFLTVIAVLVGLVYWRRRKGLRENQAENDRALLNPGLRESQAGDDHALLNPEEYIVWHAEHSDEVVLRDWGLSEGSGSFLSSVLSSPSSRMTHLDLSYNYKLEDVGVELLCPGLESQHCHLETLRLIGCCLSVRSGSLLSSVLSTPSSRLTQLDLSENMLEDLGVELLSAGLISPHCRLESLSLSQCDLSERSGSLLSSVLSFPYSHLTQLDLSFNTLYDQGVELLSAGLKSPRCHLVTLRLKACGLSERSGAHLSSVLSCPSSRLTHLDLSLNYNLEDPGVEQLSVGLKSPNCCLETLSLSECRISERGFASLASALTSNPFHLRELDLNCNLPGGPGLEQLSAGLENPDWKLETLRHSTQAPPTELDDETCGEEKESEEPGLLGASGQV